MEKLFRDGDEQQPVQSYGESLKSRRKERGITIKELSKKIGISQREIINAELGLIEFVDHQKIKIEEFIRKQRII